MVSCQEFIRIVQFFSAAQFVLKSHLHLMMELKGTPNCDPYIILIISLRDSLYVENWMFFNAPF
jgi:hypothetical protein